MDEEEQGVMEGQPVLGRGDGLVAPLVRRTQQDQRQGSSETDGQRFPSAWEPSEARRSSPLTSVCPFILGNELCERLAYYGLSTNLVVYFQEVLDLPTAEANTQVNIWMGTCYLTPLLGAIVADSYLGRYKTIFAFSSLYLVGLLLLVATNVVCDQTSLDLNKLSFMLFIALYTISLGTGGIKPNVSSFGADQFNDDDPVQRKEKESFFNWFYMFINIGTFNPHTNRFGFIQVFTHSLTTIFDLCSNRFADCLYRGGLYSAGVILDHRLHHSSRLHVLCNVDLLHREAALCEVEASRESDYESDQSSFLCHK